MDETIARERAFSLKASKHDGLHEALQAEFEAIRTDVCNWGLEPLGVERVLATVAALETGTAVDMTTWQLTNVDVRRNLAARLKNARDLKAACVEAVEGALRCDWLQEWLVEAEGDSGSGFSGVLAPKQRILA